jgi:hypothetical protein
MKIAAATVFAFAWLAAPAVGANQSACDAARCAVQEAINSECSCDEATNHGRYVSCVAHVVKRLSSGDDPLVPRNCKGKVTRCAARSVCGKEGFVTCQLPVYGTCDATTGTCAHDAAVACTTDAECVVGTRCKLSSSAEACGLRGGTPSTSPTCCPGCGS